MKLPTSLILVTASVGFLSPIVNAFDTVFTKQHCYTVYATRKVNKIPTVTTSVTSNYVLTESLTTTPTYTSYPTGTLTTIATFVTKTVTVTKGKGTFTSTITQTDTYTATIDTVQTLIPTTTITQTVTPTFTHSAPGAFTPLASDPAVISAGGGSARARARRAAQLEARAASYSFDIIGGSLSSSPPRYPRSVLCSHIVESYSTTTRSFTAVVAHTVTGESQPPSYTTITSSFTHTTTVPTQPAPTVTTTTHRIIFKTTTVTTATTVESETATVTTFGPFATLYPACAADNLIGHVGGKPVEHLRFARSPYGDGAPQSAYACCVSCQDAGACGDFAFYAGQCILATAPGTCNFNAKDMTFLTQQGGSEPGFVVGNGNCGSAMYGGSQ